MTVSELISDLICDLKRENFLTVALQAPEGLKRQIVAIAEELKNAGFKVLISGAPCYGACDLDLTLRDAADVLIHFGHAPVDDTKGVIYKIWPVDADPKAVLNAFQFLSKDQSVGLVTTIQHIHLLEKVKTELESEGYNVITAAGSSRTPYNGQVLGCSFDTARKTHSDQILFFGTGVFHPIGIAIAMKKKVIACDPITGKCEEISSDRFLRRRFALIESAREASKIGIIVSPKSGQNRTVYAEKLVSYHSGAVIVSMTEVTPDQLLNLGFDAYVNTACPRLAYDDQIRFHVPLLSPPEFEILCGVRSWDDYKVDEIL